MNTVEFAFWLAAGFVVYTHLLYPILLALVAWLRPRPVRRGDVKPNGISMILAVLNEEDRIVRRLKELSELLTATGLPGEILVISDGSTDDTAELARNLEDEFIRVIELPERGGKALALTAGWAAARYEILVFADARQVWALGTLEALLENFADPEVGAVSGDLIIHSKPGVMTGVGLYWRFEKWLRRTESRIHSTVGITGAISAVRRELFTPIPPGTLLDDVYWPMCVVFQGYRVVHDERAHAYDHLPEKPRDEFRRKVRTLAGNFQLLTRLAWLLVPIANPVWVQFLSHKLFRLIVPWALLVVLGCSVMLPGTLYALAFWGQVVCYGLALVGIWAGSRIPSRLLSGAACFLVLNAAAFAAFWVWITGRAAQSWTKISYAEAVPELPRTRPAPTPKPVEMNPVS